LDGLSKADELNVESPSGRADGRLFEIQFSELPERQENRTLIAQWTGTNTLRMEGLGQGWKPQTLFFRLNGGKWDPTFTAQTLADISAAVAYLAPVCENSGWCADPFDRLIAWGVETIPSQHKGNIQDAYTLIAKLRRRHGLEGGNFLAGAAPPIAASSATSPSQAAADGFYSPTDIAKAMGVPGKADAIRKALQRLFKHDQLPDTAWMENSNPARGQAKLLYKLSAVRPLLHRFSPAETA